MRKQPIKQLLLITAISLLTHISSGQNIHFNNTSGDGIWGNAQNWDTDTLPTASDNPGIGSNLTARILAAGAVGDILRVGSNNATLGGPGTLVISNTTATLSVQELRISNGNNSGLVHFVEGQIDATQSGGVEAIYVGYDTNAPATLIMGSPGANDADTILNYRAGRFEVARTDNAAGTFIQESGIVDGNENFIIGQNGVNNKAVVQLNGGSFTTTAQLNMNNGDGELHIHGGSLSVNDLQMSNNGNNTSQVNIASGSFTITDQLNDRNGRSEITLSGTGELRLTGNTNVREVEYFTQSDSSVLTISMVNPTNGISAPLNIMNQGVFTNTPMIALTPPALNNAVIDTWDGGIGEWNDDGSKWDLGLIPAHAAGVYSGSVFRVITSPNAIAGKTNITSEAGWTVLHPDENNVDLQRSGSSLPGGATAAAISNLGSAVTRTNDLRIAPESGVDATSLTISTGSLTFTDTAELMIGGNSAGTVNQNGGTVEINDDLRFGPSTNSAFGGTYNLNSGNMNIRGQIIESSEPVDSAQFHVDGGVLNMVNGGNILVQSFRTGNAPASTGTYTTQGDLYTTGTAVAGYEGNGTLVIGDPTHTFSARDIVVGGLFNGTDASSGRFEIPNGTLETRTGSLRIGGNATGGTSVGTVGDVIVGNGTPGSEPVVRISGGNTEVGHGGTGTLTINSGSYSQLSNNIVIGQSGSSTGIMTVNGGVVQNNGELNLNDGVGTFIMNGGDMSVGNINQSRNTSSTIFINGGVFNNRGNLNDRDGVSELNIGGTGTLIFSGSPANRRTDNFSMGTNGVLRFNLVNTNAGVSAPLTINSSNILFTGTPSIEVDASTLPANITSTTLTNYWVGDTGTWDTAGSNWDRGTIPGASGLIEAPFSFTAISTSTNNSLIGANLLSSGTPDWQVNLPDPQTVEMVLTNGAIGIGVMATAITNTNDDVTRNANLLIANEVGADTTQLEILDGNLTLGGTNDLIIGGAEQGLVSQHQGVVTIGGNIIYGPTGAQGGEYNFNGGILHVNAIQETVPEVNRAQFHYNGGTLNVSNEVLVQRFSVAEANATNTYVMDIDLTTTGTLAVGGNTNSVGHLTLNNTNLVLDINDIGVAQNQNARGTLVVDGVTLDPNTINIAQNNDAQGTFHMLSGNVSVNGSNMTLGQNNNAQGTSIIESGVLAIRNSHNIAGDSQNDTNTVGTIIMGLSGGGTNSPLITVQGGNTELGHGGEGTFTMESGRYQQLSNNLVLGQGDRGVAVFNMNGGFLDLTNDMNFNRGNGTFNHNGGDVRTRDLRLGAVNVNGTFPAQNATYNYSGNGILDPRHLRVAESENGTFNHEAGAFATRGHLLIAGNNGNASQTRDGSTGVYNFGINAASMLTVAGGNFEVGRTTGASGTFNHLAGDVVVSDQNLNANDHNLVIGQYVNSRGTYNLTDPNGTLTLNRFDDGGLLNFNAGIGVLNQDAGTVTLNGGLINLGNNAAASNQYNMAGGSLIIRSVVINTGLDFRNNGHDTFNLSGGLLDLGGGRIHYGNRTGTNAFNFTGGTLMDVAIFDGDLDQQGGTLSIGGSIGTMLIQQGAQQGMSGNYSLAAAGTLDIEIDGTSGAGVTNGHDRLTVNGDVNLDGNLNLQVNYTINHGDSFVILENAGPNPVNGTFAGLPEGASLPNGLIISYTGGDGNDVELSAAELVGVVPAPQGGGALQLNFSGLPGTNYVVEYADNTVFPPYTWISLGNLTAGPDGAFSINRTPATASELYRARTP